MLAFCVVPHAMAESPAGAGPATQCLPSMEEGAGTEAPRRSATSGGSGTASGSAPAVVRHAISKAAISTAADLRATLAAGGVGAS